jgi:hypothetical protein
MSHWSRQSEVYKGTSKLLFILLRVCHPESIQFTVLRSFYCPLLLLMNMPPIIKALVFLALFATGIEAQKRAFLANLDSLDASSDRVPPAAGVQITTWAKGSYPQFCYDTARSQRGNGNTNVNCAISNLEVYTVTYSDCPTRPWTLCRCSDSNVSRQQFAVDFGRVPPGIRSRVVHTLIIQDSGPSAGSSNDRVLFRGNVKPAVYLHESMHSADQGFSGSSTFTNACKQPHSTKSIFLKSKK